MRRIFVDIDDLYGAAGERPPAKEELPGSMPGFVCTIYRYFCSGYSGCFLCIYIVKNICV